MAVKFANNVSTTLSAAINATQTTISVADASGLPTLSSGDYVYLTIDTDTTTPTIEVVKVTAVSSNDLTVVRGQDGTTASSFSNGTKVELRVTAAALDDISSAADTESVSISGDTMTGTLALTDDTAIAWGSGSSRPAIIGNTVDDDLDIYILGNSIVNVDASGIDVTGTISSGSITASGSVNLGTTTDGSRRFKWYNDNNHSLYYDSNLLTTQSADVLTYWENVVFRHRDSTNAVTISGSSGDISAGAITSSGQIRGTNLRAINTAGYGQIEVGGANGAYVDLKRPDTDDYDLRIVSDAGTGGRIQSNGVFDIDASGNMTFDADGGTIDLKDNGSSMASFTTSTTKILGDVAIGGSHTPLNPLHVRKYGGTHLLALETSYDTSRSGRGQISWRDGSNITGGIWTEYDSQQVSMRFGNLYNSGYNTNTSMVLRGDGTLLLGKTSSSFNTVGVEIQPTRILATKSGGQALQVNRRDSDGSIASFHRDGSAVGEIGVSAGRLYIHNNYGAGAGLRFDNGAIRPSTSTGGNEDGTTDLGSSTVRWRDLFLSNKITADFSSGRFFKYRSGSVADLEVLSDNNSNDVVRITGTGTANIFKVVDDTTALFTIADGGTTEVHKELRISSGSAYTTHLNYQDNGQNFISQATSGGLTQFRNSNGMLMEIAASGNVTIANGLTVNGNFSVLGTTTTLNTSTLQVEDNNIVLNYSSGDSSGSANDSGITIQDAVNSTTDASIKWKTAGDYFDFSHKININGNLQSWNVYSQDFYVLNSAGNAWHKWGERNSDRINLNVNRIETFAASYFAGGSGTTPAVHIRSSGNSWSEGLAVHPVSDSGYALAFFRTKASYTDQTNTWAIGNLGSTGYQNYFGLLRRSLTGGVADRTNDAIFTVNDSNGRFKFGFDPYVGANKIWHAGNDGSGSGLDADTVDGYDVATNGPNKILRSNGAGYLMIGNWIDIASTGLYSSNLGNHFHVESQGYIARSGHTTDARIRLQTSNATTRGFVYSNSSNQIGFLNSSSYWRLQVPSSGDIFWYNGSGGTGAKIWHASNDGSGSGLDADFLDGIQGSQFLRSDAADTGAPSTGTALTLGYIINNNIIIGNGTTSFADTYDNSPWYGIGRTNVAGWHSGGSTKAQMAFYWGLTLRSAQSRIELGPASNGPILFGDGGTTNWAKLTNTGMYIGTSTNNVVWHAGNDGSGSGLDADTLDGINSSQFLRSDASDTMNGELNVTRNGGITGTGTPTYSQVNIELQTSSNHVPGISFHRGGYSATTLYEYDGELYVSAWVSRAQTGKLVSFGNDGSGSGLDADTLDGLQGSSYLRSDADDAYDGVLTMNGMQFRPSNANRNLRIQGTSGGSDVGISGFTSNGTHGFQLYGTTSNTYGFLDGDWGNWDLQVTKNGGLTKRVSGSTATIWHSSNDGSGSGLDADLIDGKHFYNTHGVGDKQSITIYGDSDKFYPVVITGGSEYTSQFCIHRGYNEQAPNDWNTSTHKGGLTFRYNIMGSSGWGGYPTTINVHEVGEIYAEVLGGIDFTAHTMKHVVWLRGGGTTGARYHIFSSSAFSTVVYDDTSSNYTSGSGWLIYNHSNNAYDVYLNYLTASERDTKIRDKVFFNMSVRADANGQINQQLQGAPTPYTFWNSANDGSGSTLDADTVDGVARLTVPEKRY